MGVISDVVELTITAESSKVKQEGFGIPLIVSYSAGWVERVRTYSELTDVSVDFATTTAEYKAAAKVLGQNPRPPKLYIARGALKPTQKWTVTPTAVNLGVYALTFNGNSISFTADADATAAEIVTGLKALIDALSLGVTITGTSTMIITANAAGTFFSLGSADSKLSIVQDHADPGIATDLANIALEKNDWYGLVTTHNSKAVIDAAAAWANANKKIYAAQTQDTPVIATTISGTDDVGESTKAAGYTRVPVMFSKTTDDFADAAWIGACFPYTPGEETWKFKKLQGVTVGSYTGTQRTNMRAKNVNFYEETAGTPMTEEGVASGGQYIDLTRYLDYLQARIGERIFGRLAAVPKLPMDDGGIAVVRAEIEGQLSTDEQRRVLLPGWSVIVPLAKDISTGDRSARLLQGVSFECTYAGAIHKVKIKGTVIA